jgi:hypothetical protein
VLHAEKHTEDVRVVDGPKVFDGAVLDEAELAFETGIIHGNIETTEFRDGFVDKGADVILLLDIGTNKLCLGAQRSQFGDKGLALIVVPAGYDDLGAFNGKCHGGGAADPGKGSRNEDNLTGHDYLLDWSIVFWLVAKRRVGIAEMELEAAMQ